MATIPASENEFPEVLLAEGAAPAAPGTGLVKMYAKADGLPYSKDDAGAESPMTPNAHIADATDAHDASAVSVDPTGLSVVAGTDVQTAIEELDAGISGGGIPATIIDAAGDLIIGTAADTAARLARGTAGQALLATSTTVAWGDILPWHLWVVPMIATPDAVTGTWPIDSNVGQTGQLAYPFVVPGATNPSGAQFLTNSTGAQNDAWAIDLVLGAGTWDFHCWVRKSTNTGIITLQQDGADMGTVDTYAAAAAAAKVSVTGWAVSTSGKKRMNIKMATKNASSSAYFVTIFGIEFRRTA